MGGGGGKIPGSETPLAIPLSYHAGSRRKACMGRLRCGEEEGEAMAVGFWLRWSAWLRESPEIFSSSSFTAWKKKKLVTCVNAAWMGWAGCA